MNAGDLKAGRPSSQESWFAAPLSDPNAALWASITPPANPSLQTWLSRRLAALSPDLLAQRLHLRFPGHISSRAAAQRGILAGVAALGAGIGLIGYLAASTLSEGQPTASAQLAGSAVGARIASAAERQAEPSSGAAATRAEDTSALAREERTAVADAPVQAFTASTAPATEQVTQALQASDEPAEPQATTSKAKKRALAKKKARAMAARARAKAAAASKTASVSAAASKTASVSKAPATTVEAPAAVAPTPKRAARPRRVLPAFKFN